MNVNNAEISMLLEISDIFLYFQAPVLWNALSHYLRSHSLLKLILFSRASWQHVEYSIYRCSQ